MKRLDAYWYDQNPVAWILLPLSWLFCAIAQLRKFLYKLRILERHKLSVPVIVIGNISVGGTGKTPLIIAMCDLLKQMGFKPGIVSRGYAGTLEIQKIIDDTDSVESVGDEPCLLRKRTACPVAVGRNRVAAVRLLIENTDCDIVLSDDGLQHYRMDRDLEIAVIDANRLFGNGFCLPAGPLREPRQRLNTVDQVVYHGKTTASDYSFSLEFCDAISITTGIKKPLQNFKGEKIHAIAGIGNPARFFSQLRSAGLDIIEHPYPDHHRYTRQEIDVFEGDTVLMTEKDAVKCTGFDMNNLWYVPVNTVLSDSLSNRLMSLIRGLSPRTVENE